MAFSDPSPLEQDMNVLCENMSPEQLVTYIKDYQLAYGRQLAVQGDAERSVFKSMKRIYGEKTAGQIVKWVFYKHRGVWKGEVVVFFSFSKGRKWWTDLMHQEMQAAQRKETVKKTSRVGVGSKRLSDL
jgi:glutathione peroxidase-family protein